MAMRMAIEPVTIKARFATRENKSHAAARPFVVRYSLINGMNAIASAPPEISANNTSGKLFAALKVSNNWIDPAYWREIMPTRTNARILSIKKKNAISIDVRARKDKFFIDGINDRLMGEFEVV